MFCSFPIVDDNVVVVLLSMNKLYLLFEDK